ncbi:MULTISPECIES: hypothetical protein [Brevibacillus]|uniref:hypothetical protein n=1 Tax=Brevibacillus TaxID=55080 RepID=UPI000D10B289|nr:MULTISPECIES: hypothetical protein [Brevibacillus]MED1947043.1 hypothetical protein [Brevibacillus formosus]MED2000481.1 hypothetical protein [Brevibacillus formosus]MED2085730.1 hypothetical protein [Brevibacillus formosus]PSK13509.1 hypothetical protein C7R94_22765 [Brevibacillus sp. NRRL NRS-603]
MTTIQMIDSNAGEAMHLFEVMKKFGVTCSLEFKLEGVADPFIGISGVNVDVDYLEAEDGDTLIVNMGEAEFAFGLGDHDFSRIISDCQIMMAIGAKDGKYIAWFNSGVISPDGIVEANSYDGTVGDEDINEPEFTEEEKKLAYFIRSLDFDAVLDAVSGIHREVDHSKNKAATHLRAGRIQTANAFDKRAANLEQLACLLGEANKDYNAHVCQVD